MLLVDNLVTCLSQPGMTLFFACQDCYTSIKKALTSTKVLTHGRVQTVEWTTGMEYWTELLEWLKLIVRYM